MDEYLRSSALNINTNIPSIIAPAVVNNRVGVFPSLSHHGDWHFVPLDGAKTEYPHCLQMDECRMSIVDFHQRMAREVKWEERGEGSGV